MLNFRQLLAAFSLLAGLATVPAHAETFHTCGTIINTIPTVITTSGVYCLSHDVATAITSGSAIDIQGNNVTLDCNGYKVGGLAAGTSSSTIGIHSDVTHQNITVRNCGIRGFYDGIFLAGGAGHLIEDNRLDNNLVYGIHVLGDNNRVRRNAVYDTGGRPASGHSYGIVASADLIGNTVAGVFATDAGGAYADGIQMFGQSTEARDNQVRGLVAISPGFVTGILSAVGQTTMRDNSIALTAVGTVTGNGINGGGGFCMGNTFAKFSTPMINCQDAGGNASQ